MIECDKTRYRAELEFKLKPFFGGAEASNAVVGKIKLGTKTIATLEGKWDGEIHWKDEGEGQVSPANCTWGTNCLNSTHSVLDHLLVR